MKSKRSIAIVILVIAVVAAAVLLLRGRADSPEVLQARADENLAEGRFDAALLDYRRILSQQPDNLHALRKAGQIWMERGVAVRALPYLNEARKYDLGDGDERLRWAEALLSIGDVRGARAEALATLAAEPKHERALLLLANTTFGEAAVREARLALSGFDPSTSAAYHVADGIFSGREGHADSVETALRRAVALAPDSVPANLALATFASAQGKSEEALARLAAASRLAEPRSSAHLNYAQTLAQAERFDEADKVLEGVLAKAPDYLPAHRVRAELRAAQGKPEEALELLKNVFEIDPVNIDGRSAEARIHLAMGNSDKALEAVEILNEAFPEAPRVKLTVASYALRNGDEGKAREALKDITNLAPPESKIYADAVILLAELDLRRGDTSNAITRLEQLVALRPDLSNLSNLLSRAYQAAGRLEDAAELFRTEIQNSPQRAASHFALAQILRQQDRLEDAYKEFEEAQRLAPNDQSVTFELVGMDILQERFETAHGRVEVFLTKNQEDWGAWYLKGRILSAEERWREAEEALLKALDLKPGSLSVYSLLIENYLANEEVKEAISRLGTLIKENPRAIRYRMLLALLLEQEKDFEAAVEEYKSLLAEYPGFVPALNNLAYIFSHHLEDLPEAEMLARRARQAAPGDPSVADTLGWILVRQNDDAKLREGLLLIQEAVTANDSPEIQYHLGVASLDAGQRGQARSALRQAVEGQVDPAPWKAEAQRLLDKIENEDANLAGLGIEELEKLLATDEFSVALRSRLGQLHEAAGDGAKAVKSYRDALQLDEKDLESLKGLARLLATSDPAAASDYARQAYEEDSDDLEAAALHGRWELSAGRVRSAYGLMRPAASQAGAKPALLSDFASAAYAIGKVDESRTALQRVPGNAPQHDSAQRFLLLTSEPTPANSAEITAAATAELERNPRSVPALMAKASRLAKEQGAAAAIPLYVQVREVSPEFLPATLALASLYAEDPARLDAATALVLEARQKGGESPAIEALLELIKAKRAELEEGGQ